MKKNTKTKSNLILSAIEESQRTGKEAGLSLPDEVKKVKLDFMNLDVDSIKSKKEPIEYASVKIKTHLYEQIREEAERRGIKQTGKFISLILETFLQQQQMDDNPLLSGN
jgi:hypothetical protein